MLDTVLYNTSLLHRYLEKVYSIMDICNVYGYSELGYSINSCYDVIMVEYLGNIFVIYWQGPKSYVLNLGTETCVLQL